jgi:predicted amidohydrolase
MSRPITLAGAQLGPIHRADSRASVVKRLMALLRQAHGKGAGLVVFPELALTTFFPRWYMEDQAEVDTWFETEMPGPETKPLFDLAAELKIGFYLGYAEKCVEDGQVHRYNTAILVDRDGKTVGKYRKVHLPGHTKYVESYPWQHLEKRYFEVGNLGFPVWRTMGGVMGMCICNDRRWPETYRVMGMKGAEVVMLGYNTPTANRESNTIEPPHLRMMHNQMSMQMGAYQNGTWVVGVAKAGAEDGFDMIVVDADLDECTFNKTTIFNFAAHRRPEAYGIITAQAGVTPPPEE